MFALSYSDKAQEDILEVVKWYSLQRVDLGTDFLVSIEATISKLENNPYQHRKYFREIRSIMMKRFPYRVIYKIVEDNIVIVGVFHTKRNPAIITKRARE